MRARRYLYRSLIFYRKQHLALLVGTIISTAVLTGALIIGDSVSYSLTRLTQKRLGNIQYAVEAGERFVTDRLTVHMQQQGQIQSSALLHFTTMVIEPESDARIQAAQLYGIDSSFSLFFGIDSLSMNEPGFWISENIANRLKLTIGQDLLVKFRDVNAVPVQTPFSPDESATKSLRLPVSRILDEDEFSRFSLLSDQKAPYNIFVGKKQLQQKMGLIGKSNLLVFSSPDGQTNESKLNEILTKSIHPGDAAIQIQALQAENTVEIKSDRVFIDHSIVDSLAGLGGENILTYLVNSIGNGQSQTPYSFVSGLSDSLLPYSLGKEEIILNDWCAADLGVQTGDSVLLSYFIIDAFRNLKTEESAFIVKGIEKNQDALFKSDLMPDFPGLADAKSCSEWDTGIPIDLEKIRDKDEKYWEDYKGTPKAIVSFEVAASLWGNRYGNATAVRLPATEMDLFNRTFGELVPPETIGLSVRDVKDSGLRAAANGVDFGELFLSLSFFVIVSGILLLILLYSLNLLSRRAEIDKLKAIGLSKKTIFFLFFSETLIPVLIGNFLGVILGIFYNQTILWGLNGLWQDAVRTQALEVFIDPLTLLTGFVLGTLISSLTVYFVLRNILKEKTIFHKPVDPGRRTTMFYQGLGLLFVLVSGFYLIYSMAIRNYLASAGFMAFGALLMLALLIFFWLTLTRRAKKTNPLPTVDSLAYNYLSRNRKRSLLIVSLVAFGTFSVLVTGINRKSFHGLETDRASGTGGYLFWMETAFPLINDPNTERGKEIYGFGADDRMDSITFLPLYTLTGDDASCLNLNQVENPGVLGIDPQILSDRGSFSFTKVVANIDKNDPWLSLNDEWEEGVIPAFIDQTVITWGLMKSIGDTLHYRDEFGRELKMVIAGGLANTIFQGYVLIARQNMQKYYPSVPGANVCLIDAQKGKEVETAAFLDRYFRDYGIEYRTTSDKLAEFHSVSNTYLNVFLVLGAIGMLIGTFGFGIVLARNRLERRKDRAVLSALGISSRGIRQVLIKEHLYLLFIGIFIASLGALYSAIPSFFSEAFSMPYIFMSLILTSVLLSGIVWIYLFSGSGSRENLSDYLRKE